jgi:hypothetical protein
MRTKHVHVLQIDHAQQQHSYLIEMQYPVLVQTNVFDELWDY